MERFSAIRSVFESPVPVPVPTRISIPYPIQPLVLVLVLDWIHIHWRLVITGAGDSGRWGSWRRKSRYWRDSVHLLATRSSSEHSIVSDSPPLHQGSPSSLLKAVWNFSTFSFFFPRVFYFVFCVSWQWMLEWNEMPTVTVDHFPSSIFYLCLVSGLYFVASGIVALLWLSIFCRL